MRTMRAKLGSNMGTKTSYSVPCVASSTMRRPNRIFLNFPFPRISALLQVQQITSHFSASDNVIAFCCRSRFRCDLSGFCWYEVLLAWNAVWKAFNDSLRAAASSCLNVFLPAFNEVLLVLNVGSLAL